MKKSVILTLVAVLALAMTLPSAWAQAMGSVKGTSQDENGKPIVGATVEFYSLDNGSKRTVKTGKDGSYFTLGVPLGNYRITLLQQGKAPVVLIEKFPVNFGENTYDIKIAQQGGDAQAKAAHEAAMKEQNIVKNLNEMLKQALEAQQAGNFDQAIDILTKATQADATRDLIWARLGNAHRLYARKLKGSDRDAAKQQSQLCIEAFNKAISIKSSEAAYHDNVGECLANTGQVDDAIRAFDQAAQLDPTHAGQYYFNSGAILTNTGKTDAATAAFDKAIAADPTYADAYYQKAINMMAKGKVDPKTGATTYPPEVAQGLQKYLELKPTGPYAGTAKELLASLGAKVETTFGKKSATTPKKK